MKKKNKIISVLLVACFMILIPMKASANVKNVTDTSLNAAIEVIRAQHEDAEIVVEDGVIHVYIPEESNNVDVALSESENIIYAPEGGTWGNFVPPWYTYLDPSAVIPYSVLYLPEEPMETVYVATVTDGLVEVVLSALANNVEPAKIITMVVARFGLQLTVDQILFIDGTDFIAIYEAIDAAMFTNVFLETEKGVKIEYTTVGGWPVNYYSVWESNYVTDYPYHDFNPTFYHEIYSVSDI